MDRNYASWYKSIFTRYSVRNYDGKPLKEEDIIKIENMCEIFRPFKEVRAVFVNTATEHICKGIIGSYGKIKGAPAYLAFIGDTSCPNIYEMVGYAGEGLILEATSMGLGTCWISGTFNPKAVEENIELYENERVFAVSPIGYITHELSFDQRLFSKLIKKGKKSLEEISEFTLEDDWIKEAIDSARLAPSAINRQPWRFEKGDEAIYIKVDKQNERNKLSKRLDCGIAMLHFELGAYNHGVNGRWHFLDWPYVGKFDVLSKS